MVLIVAAMILSAMPAMAQIEDDPFKLDENLMHPFTLTDTVVTGKQLAEELAAKDSVAATKQPAPKRDWSTWKPEPKKAMWMAIVFPGGGQIYNHKYWKLPIFYGGFVGCAYAYSWNNQMYSDYAQAYMDMMDDDDTTNSFMQMHMGSQINESNMSRYQKLFKQRKDRFRRYRDMSIFCIIGVYALSIIDAYVDASLSEFDISDDLSLRISPAYINDKHQHSNPYAYGGLGLQCSLNF